MLIKNVGILKEKFEESKERFGSNIENIQVHSKG